MPLMRRQSLVKFDAPLCETVVEAPKPAGREVLVRIERCGLCHSDLHIQDGFADLGGGKKLDTVVVNGHHLEAQPFVEGGAHPRAFADQFNA